MAIDELEEKIVELKIENERLNSIHRSALLEIEHLQKKISQMQMCFKLPNHAMLFIDRWGIITDCNKGAVFLFDLQLEQQLIGRSVFDFFDFSKRYVVQKIISSVLDFGQSEKIDEDILTSSNKVVPSIIVANRLNDEGIVMLAIHDVSIQKAEEQRQKSKIDYLTRVSNVNEIINKVKSTSCMLNTFYKDVLDYCNANEMWGLVKESEGIYNYIFASNIAGKPKKLNPLRRLKIQDNLLKSRFPKSGIYTLSKDKIISLSDQDTAESIELQQLMVCKIVNDHYFILGMNHSDLNTNISKETAFLEELYSRFLPIYENIVINEELRAYESKFRVMTENMSDVVLLRDSNGNFPYISSSIRKYGYNVEDINHQTIKKIFPTNSYADLVQKLDEVIAFSGKSVDISNVIVLGKDGIERRCSITMTNMLHLKEIDGVVIVVKDLTEKFIAEDHLRESEHRLRTIFETMIDGVHLCNKDNHRIVYMNNALQNQVGNVEENDLCYNKIYGFDQPCRWCVSTRAKLGVSYSVNAFDQRQGKYYHVIKTLIQTNDGPSVLHISRDVTRLRLSENLIRQSEGKFKSIFNNSSDAIFITDEKGNYLEVNAAALQRSGFSREEFLKLNLRDVKQYSETNKIDQYFYDIFQHGKAITEIYYINQLNQELYTEINGSLIDFENRKAILHFSRDISSRKEVQRKILEASIQTEERERGRFAKDLHDGIGPYLSATKFFMETLAIEDNKESRKLIADKALVAIDDIIKNIKEISNNLSPHLLSNFGIISALKSFKKKLPVNKTKINLETNIEGVRFSESIELSIFRITIELINNTLKYANAGEMNIMIFQKSEMLHFLFSHNGLGFDWEKEWKEGTGAGLSNIVNRVSSLKGKCLFDTSPETGLVFKAKFIIEKTDGKN